MAERVKAEAAGSAAGRTGSDTTRKTGKRAATKKAAKSTAQTNGDDTGGTTMAKPADTTSTGARGGAKGKTKAAGSGSARSKTTATPAKGTKSAKSAKSAEPAKPKKGRSAAETERIRVALHARRDELLEEYDSHLVEITELQRDRLTDSAGDDQADTGSKTFEREQEISLANSILERVKQVERALERLDEGSYGWCERCGDAIPVERLAAFPSATLCVNCKQLEERR